MPHNTHVRHRPGLAALAVTMLSAAVPAATGTPAALAAPGSVIRTDTVTARARLTDHVLVISVDGLRPDAIARFGARHMQRLMAEGSFSLEATTIVPSTTLPAHTSMLTGTEPGAHGVTWNSEELEEHGYVATPTIFATAKAAGLHTAAFFSKEKFRHLAVPGTLDYFQAPGGWPGKWLAPRLTGDVERYLERHRPNLLFVHISEPDFAGHLMGWMSTAYGWAVRDADQAVGRLVAAAERAFGRGSFTVLLTSDHGGHGRDHGTDDPRDVTIPWIAWGRGIGTGGVLDPGIRTMDTAATVLQLLGLENPADAIGKPVSAALAPAAAAVAGPAGS